MKKLLRRIINFFKRDNGSHDSIVVTLPKNTNHVSISLGGGGGGSGGSGRVYGCGGGTYKEGGSEGIPRGIPMEITFLTNKPEQKNADKN